MTASLGPLLSYKTALAADVVWNGFAMDYPQPRRHSYQLVSCYRNRLISDLKCPSKTLSKSHFLCQCPRARRRRLKHICFNIFFIKTSLRALSARCDLHSYERHCTSLTTPRVGHKCFECSDCPFHASTLNIPRPIHKLQGHSLRLETFKEHILPTSSQSKLKTF